jgi:hypothetical protein
MNWSHPLIVIVVSSIAATLTTVAVEGFLKPASQEWWQRHAKRERILELARLDFARKDREMWRSRGTDCPHSDELDQLRHQRHFTGRDFNAGQRLIDFTSWDDWPTNSSYPETAVEAAKATLAYLEHPAWKLIGWQNGKLRTRRSLRAIQQEACKELLEAIAAERAAERAVERDLR